jgi:sterol desaturase/sphingolipid hydroxylase (fatty acid hydroxylase superfamily)
MNASQITAIIIPVLFLSLFLEHRYIKKMTGKGYDLGFFIENLQQTLGQQAINIVKRAFVIPFLYLSYEYRLFTVETSIYSILITFILFDFMQYWFHRISHTFQILWGFHVVHHSANDMNLSVSFRNPWFIQIVSISWQCSFVLLGMHPDVVVAIITIGYIIAFWVHAKMIKRMPKLEKVIITPSLHRIHHSSRKEHLDKNFGHFFSIWDRLFGTFCSDEVECDYGLIQKTNISNPLWQNTYYFFFIYELMKRAPSILEMVKVPFSSIAYSPSWIEKSEYKKLMMDTAHFKLQPFTLNRVKLFLYFLVLVGMSQYLAKAKFMDQSIKVAFSLSFLLILTLMSISTFSKRTK